MKNSVEINETIKPFNKSIDIEGDKSLSIRWALLASQAIGRSKSFNLLRSEDVINTLNCLKKLGIKIKLSNKFCEITGNGLNGFCYKKNICLGYVKAIDNDNNDLFIEVEGKRYALKLEKKPIHDPSSKLLRS